MARESLRPLSARVRGNRLRHHHHALGRRRDRAHRRQPAGAGVGESSGRPHPAAAVGALGRLSEGVQRGYRLCRVHRRHLSRAQPDCDRVGHLRGRASSRILPEVARRPGAGARQLGDDAGGRADRVSEAGAGLVGFRDRRRRDAARRRRSPRRSGDATGPHPEHEEAPAHRRAHHDGDAHGQLGHHDAADSGARVRGRRQSLGPRSGVPGARAPRRGVRHDLRPEHDLDPVVRGGVGDGRAAESRAALSAALRHGPRMGARLASARGALHQSSPSSSPSSSTPTSKRRAVRTPPAFWS